jgi:hypothetical protein
VKALERRLKQHTQNVKDSAHISMIKAHAALELRVQALILLHRSVSQWMASSIDGHLLEVAKCMKPLQAFLQHMQIDLAPDMHILMTEAQFQSVVMSTGLVSTAFAVVDLVALTEWFAEFKRQLCTVDFKQELDDEDEIPEEAVGLGKVRARAKSNKPAPIVPQLVTETDSCEFATRIVDKALQSKLFALRPDSEFHMADVASVLQDFSALLALWHTAIPHREGAAFGLGEIIESITVVLGCVAGCGKGPLPSAVRDAKQKLHKGANSIKPPFRIPGLIPFAKWFNCVCIMHGF